tara:strand:- start:3254 stop:4342 length:1089 start_codon:yes stop_codon:yes gene_type:complete
MNHLKKKEYELNITTADVDKAVAVTRIVNKSANATYVKHGRNNTVSAMQFNLSYYQHIDEEHYQREYKNFDSDPQIGGRKCLNLNHAFLMTVSHEVSHLVQRIQAPKIKRFAKTHSKSHGDCFKAIYRYLRRDLVNPIIDKDIINQQIKPTKETKTMLKKSIISNDIAKQLATQEARHVSLKGLNKNNATEMSDIKVDQFATLMPVVASVPRNDTANISEASSTEILTTLVTACNMTDTQSDLFKRNCVLFCAKHDLPKSNCTKEFVIDLFDELGITSQAKLISHNKGEDVKSPLDQIIDKLCGLKTKTGKQRDGLIMTQAELDQFSNDLVAKFNIADAGRKAIDEAIEENDHINEMVKTLG